MEKITDIRRGKKDNLCIDCLKRPAMENCTICKRCDWENQFTKKVYDKYENNPIFPEE